MNAPLLTLTDRMVSAYFQTRVQGILDQWEADRIRTYISGALLTAAFPPLSGTSVNLKAVSYTTGIPYEKLREARKQLKPIFDALLRALRGMDVRPAMPKRKPPIEGPRVNEDRKPPSATPSEPNSPTAIKRTRRSLAKPLPEFPQPLWPTWQEVNEFAAALDMHMRRHGETYWLLHRALRERGCHIEPQAIRHWCTGVRKPRSVRSMDALRRIERRYRLPAGYFEAKLTCRNRSLVGYQLPSVGPSEARRIAWHLPGDFNFRSREEQAEILSWVRTNIIQGTTDYRQFQAEAARHPYAVRFSYFQRMKRSRSELKSGSAVDAPRRFDDEVNDLVRFKTSTLTTLGFQRNGVWNSETASQRVEHLALLFGALAAPSNSKVQGLGVPVEHLTLAMLALPAVWDWYLQWRERKRGFFTAWETDMLTLGLAFVRPGTGWLRQNPGLSERLEPIPGLVTQKDIERARSGWDAQCDAMAAHAKHRVQEVSRVVRIHRDPFEPILPILEADSPVAEYRKITDEIVRLMPDPIHYPLPAAEAVRSLLMLRFGLHLGLRQKNLRELMVCKPGDEPRTERQLEEMRRGEIRWSKRDGGWEVLIPSIAFKNASSSFFGSKPFRLVLPDLDGLYGHIRAYVEIHRHRLLGSAQDPGTFFVKTVKTTSASAAYDQTTFYEAWRLIIQRYGIYNPYTGNGAIVGLLPHGPHNIRDVLATHILKQTGSYEQASYAIQDTPEMVKQHYGRFLPQDKAAIAAQVLNRVWTSAA